MARLGSAVVGTGFIGPVHIEALRRLGIPILGVLGASPEKSRLFAESLGIPRAYASYDELLADPNVHTVHLASPNRLHYDQSRRALAAGKHVICEKPLALSVEESSHLVELSQQKALVAGVCYNVRFYPLCLEARAWIASGRLGEIYHVTGSYIQDWLLHDTDFNWRVLVEEGGPLRAIADIGTHWLDLAQSITGLNVTAVCADLKTVLPVRRRPKTSVDTFQTPPTQCASERIAASTTPLTLSASEGIAAAATPLTLSASEGIAASAPHERLAVDIVTEDYGSVLLHFDHGAHGCFSVSQVCAGRKNCLRIEIAGSAASLAWNSENPTELWIGERDRPNELLIRDPALLQPAARAFTDYPGGHNEGFPDTFKQLFRAIYAYIDRGDFTAPRPFPTFADGHRETVLCQAILQSQRERAWVKLRY
jgi:predicted dehydrogenase